MKPVLFVFFVIVATCIHAFPVSKENQPDEKFNKLFDDLNAEQDGVLPTSNGLRTKRAIGITAIAQFLNILSFLYYGYVNSKPHVEKIVQKVKKDFKDPYTTLKLAELAARVITKLENKAPDTKRITN